MDINISIPFSAIKTAIKIFYLISSVLYMKILLIRNQMTDKLAKNKFKNKYNIMITNAYLMMFVLLLRVPKMQE